MSKKDDVKRAAQEREAVKSWQEIAAEVVAAGAVAAGVDEAELQSASREQHVLFARYCIAHELERRAVPLHVIWAALNRERTTVNHALAQADILYDWPTPAFKAIANKFAEALGVDNSTTT